MTSVSKILTSCIVFLLFISAAVSFSQNTIYTDSLINAFNKSKNDSDKVNTLIELCRYFLNSEPGKAVKYGEQSLELAQKNNYRIGIARSLYWTGFSYYNFNNPAKALEYYSLSLEKYIEISNNSKPEEKKKAINGKASCYMGTGNVLSDRGNYIDAMNNYLKSINEFEKLKEFKDETYKIIITEGEAFCYNDIGLIQWQLKNYEKAEEYFLITLKTYEDLKNSGDNSVLIKCKYGMAYSFSNLGIISDEQRKFTKSISYYTKALKLLEELEDKKGVSACYTNIGASFEGQKKYDLSIENYMKSLKIKEDINDKKGIAIVLGNIASLQIQQKKYNEAFISANKSLNISEELGILESQRNAYAQLAASCDSLQDYKKAVIYYKKLKLFNDSIFNIGKNKQFSEIEGKYQNEKKQKEIQLLNKDKALQTAEIKRQTIQNYSLIGGLALVLVLAFVIYRSNIRKRKDNILLTQQKNEIENKNEELNQQNEEILSQRDEIEAQRDLVMHQKEEIEVIHNELTSSIRYAKSIQQAVLPNDELTHMFLGEHFILFKPKDIVSGDFYWTMIKKNWLLAAVADCTGHGVPGAFMSMLGISFMNEIIAESDFTSVSNILNNLREHIIKSLRQQSTNNENYQNNDHSVTQNLKDGMDISLIAINLETYEMQFAGANNPVYIVRKSESRKPCLPSTPLRMTAGRRKIRNFQTFDFQTFSFTNSKVTKCL